MKHTTEELLLADRVRELCKELRTKAGSRAWQALGDGNDRIPRDIWIALEFAPQHPLKEYVPAALRELADIATAISQSS